MIRCIECGADQLIGALFCNECGAFLLEQQQKGQTAVLPFSQFIAHAPPPPLSQNDLELAVEPVNITVVIPHSRRRLQTVIIDELRIGRSDSEFQPELDLTNDDGGEKGVSRLHACIKSLKSGLVLIDLDSTNGTMLNTYKVPPNRPYPLKNGDEIRFGDFLIHIFFD
jgi:hypothetical protein